MKLVFSALLVLGMSSAAYGVVVDRFECEISKNRVSEPAQVWEANLPRIPDGLTTDPSITRTQGSSALHLNDLTLILNVQHAVQTLGSGTRAAQYVCLSGFFGGPGIPCIQSEDPFDPQSTTWQPVRLNENGIPVFQYQAMHMVFSDVTVDCRYLETLY